MANLWPPSLMRATDDNGNPSPGAKMEFFATGTTTHATFYLDAAEATAGANPLEADGAGMFPPVFLHTGTIYRIKQTNAAGSETFFDVDPVDGSSGGNVMSIGTLAQAATMTIPVGTDLVQVSGFASANDDGAGMTLVHDGTVDAAYVAAHPDTSFIDLAGRGFRRVREGVRVAGDLGEMQAINAVDGVALIDDELWLFEEGNFADYADGRTIASVDTTMIAAGARVRIPLMSRNLSPSRARQMLMTSMAKMNDHGGGLINVGDSISHGAHCGGIHPNGDDSTAYTNSWSWLMARAVNAAFDTRNPGFHPMEHVYHAVVPSKQLHDVTFSAGHWGAVSANPAPYNYPIGNIGPAGANACTGKSFTSTSAAGATITIETVAIAEFLRLRVKLQPGGSGMTVTVNGNAVNPVVEGVAFGGALIGTDTSVYAWPGIAAGSTRHNVDVSIPIVDDGKGKCTIVLTKTADTKPFEIASVIGYTAPDADPTALSARMRFNNYSQSGRTLSDMSEDNIIYCCDAAGTIWSLGVNDWLGLNTDTDDAAFAIFKSKIDLIIKYSRVFKGLVVVQDFIWYRDLAGSRTRQQLARLARLTNGIYIPYADQFFCDSALPTQYDAGTGTPATLNNPYYLWADDLHPYANGHELVFATLATAMGLPVTSKRQALMYHDWSYPLTIDHADFTNMTPDYVRTLSNIRQVGESYEIRLNLKHSAGTIPSGTLFDIFAAIPPKFRGKLLNFLPVRVPGAINYATGLVDCTVLINASGTPDNLKAYVSDAYVDGVRCTALLKSMA